MCNQKEDMSARPSSGAIVQLLDHSRQHIYKRTRVSHSQDSLKLSVISPSGVSRVTFSDLSFELSIFLSW